MPVSDKELEKLVSKYLGEFNNARLARLKDLKLRDSLSKKNPYLFRAIGSEKVSDIVEYLLNAILSASDETIFGNSFFEPLAKAVSIGGIVAPAKGVDIAIETKTQYSAYAVKSGTKWGNSSQKSQQKTDFEELRKRLYKIHKQFDPVVGHGYGIQKTEFNSKVGWRDVAGQAFWHEITGDSDLYLKLMRLMKEEPQKHRVEFKKEWDKLVNLFTKEFIEDFCNLDGSINWEKLTKFVSEESGQIKKELQVKYRTKARKEKNVGKGQSTLDSVDDATD